MFETPVTNISIRSKPKPNPAVRHGPVTPQVEIPFVIGRIHFVSSHVFLEHFQPFLALAAADDLADAGNEHVHRGHGFAVVVQPHVERFDLLRIIENRDRTFEMFFG